MSSDITHLVTVTAGDTLPDLCYNIYGDTRYYARVAAFNNLVDYRNLTPGQVLAFPPLD